MAQPVPNPSSLGDGAQGVSPAPLPRPASSGKLWLHAILFTVVVFLISVVLDWFLLFDVGGSALATFQVSDALAAVIAGAVFFQLLRERQKTIVRRLETIAEMNHHIRNALEVISLASYGRSEKEKEVAAIRDSVDRITWALTEILPKL